ncbi:MAG: hypothetical protein GY943_03315 [Chloroflexi bacterium]|nr:hypothetical protein [Chloroflexota bacterium]
MFDFEALLIGAGVGLISAIIGAIIDYRFISRNRKEQAELENGRLPGCIFLVSGSLGFLGIVVIFLSFLVESVKRALIAGLGVGLGFFVGFVIMMLVWFFTQRKKR